MVGADPFHSPSYTINGTLHLGSPQLVQYLGQHADAGGHWWFKDTGIEASGEMGSASCKVVSRDRVAAATCRSTRPS